MIGTSQDYFIKPGYRARRAAETIEEHAGDYWDANRVRDSRLYQYYVYETAAEVAAELGGRVRLLDVGCGYPAKLELVAAHAAQVTVVDQPSLAAVVRTDFPGVEFLPMNLEQPSSLARVFDLIVFSDVVEHLLDPNPAMQFLAAHLAPGGRLVISTPERDVLRGIDCMSSEKPEHVREWNQAEFHCYLSSHGFSVERSLLLPTMRLAPDQIIAMRDALPQHRAPYSGCQTVVCTRR